MLFLIKLNFFIVFWKTQDSEELTFVAEASVAAAAAVTHSQPESTPAAVDKEDEIPEFSDSQKEVELPSVFFFYF